VIPTVQLDSNIRKPGTLGRGVTRTTLSEAGECIPSMGNDQHVCTVKKEDFQNDNVQHPHSDSLIAARPNVAAAGKAKAFEVEALPSMLSEEDQGPGSICRTNVAQTACQTEHQVHPSHPM